MTTSLGSPAALCSITWRGLNSLLSELAIPALDLREWQLPRFNTHDLRPILVERGIYPAREFPHLIEKRPPDLFVTYDWREQILAVRANIWRALEYCLRSEQGRGVDLEDVAENGVSFWLDWIFIDQSSRNVDQELDLILPVLFKESAVHFVASVTALTRAWCCYELAQFNRSAAAGNGAELTSLIPGDLWSYPLWAGVVSTDPEDKVKVEKRIVEGFPDGLHGLEGLMVQAGLAADLRTDTGAAADHIANAAARWVRRFRPLET